MDSFGDIAAEDRADAHQLLLELAGWLPDDAIARARGQLADDELTAMAEELVAIATAVGLRLTEGQVDLLDDLVSESAPSLAHLVDPESVVRFGPCPYAFTSDLPDLPELLADRSVADRAVAGVVAASVGSTAVWRAWRTGGPAEPGVVYVVEVEPEVDPVPLTGALQRAVLAEGEATPRVETYCGGDDLPAYQRLARAEGVLIWTSAATPEIHVATLFDHVDPVSGPGFEPAHPRLTDAERDRVADYLDAGEVLILGTSGLDDVLMPELRGAVPVNFRTDGTWVWSDASTYYLRTYGLAPDVTLLAHIRSRNYLPPLVDTVAAHRAMAVLRQPQVAEPSWVFDQS